MMMEESQKLCANCSSPLITFPGDENEIYFFPHYSNTLVREIRVPHHNADNFPNPLNENLSTTTKLEENTHTQLLKISDILSSIYNIQYSTSFKSRKSNVCESEEEIVMCFNCSQVLTTLYNVYEEFSRIRVCHSYLDRMIKEMDQFLECHNNCKIHSPATININDDKDQTTPDLPTNLSLISPWVKLTRLSPEEILNATKRSNVNPSVNNNVDEVDGFDDNFDSPCDSSFNVSGSEISDTDSDSSWDMTRKNSVRKNSKRNSVKTRQSNKNSTTTETDMISNEMELKSGVSKLEDPDNPSSGPPGTKKRGRKKIDKSERVRYACTYPSCTKTFSRNWDMKNHKRVHTKERPYSCEHCESKFTQSCALAAHIRKIHLTEKKKKVPKRGGPHECTYPDCQMSFIRAWDLKTHERTHNKQRPYICPYCSGHFSQSSSLSTHIRNMHKQEEEAKRVPKEKIPTPWLCFICGLSYAHKSRLEMHMVYHRDERQFPCSNCNLAFKLKRDLRRHEQVHFKPTHLCSYCGKAFVRSQGLRDHLLVHTHERPYRCVLCDLAFAFNKPLKQHLVKVHGEEYEYLAGIYKRKKKDQVPPVLLPNPEQTETETVNIPDSEKVPESELINI